MRSRLHAAAFESFEPRRLLSGVVDSWSGQAGDNLWSSANNWRTFNNQIVIPSSGQDIRLNLYSGNTTAQTAIDTGTDRTIGKTYLQNVILNDNALTLHGDLSGSYSTINSNVLLDHNLTFGGSGPYDMVRFAGAINDGGQNYGVNIFSGALTYQSSTSAPVGYTGPTTLSSGGSLFLLGRAMSSYVTLNATNSNFYAAGDGIGFTSNGGSVYLRDSNVNGNTSRPTENGNVTLDSASSVEFNLEDPSNGGAAGSSQLIVNSGTITLGGASLSLYPGVGHAATMQVGTSYTIIANNTGQDVVGTFHELPDGATFIQGGFPYVVYQINYHGGVSGHDVVATVVNAPTNLGEPLNPNVTLQINRPTARTGNEVTVTANVSGDDGNGHSPTGVVQFYDGTTPVGTPQTIVNGSVSFSSTTLSLGGHSFCAVYRGDSNFPVFDSDLFNRTAGVGISAPIVFNSVSGGSSISGKSQHFEVSATSPNSSEPQLTYSWSTIKAPSGAKPVVFSDNDTNSAKSMDVRVYKDGVYRFEITISDSNGSSSQDVYLDVRQTATAMRLTPHASIIAPHSARQFSGVALDQFNHPMRAGDSLIWSILSGPGSITAGGLFSSTALRGKVTLQAEADDLLAMLGARVA